MADKILLVDDEKDIVDLLEETLYLEEQAKSEFDCV